MKKKIFFAVLCIAIPLIFTSLSYGAIGNKFQNQLPAHPWDDPCEAPGKDTTAVNVFILSIGPNTILTLTLNGIKSATENIYQSNINQEKWIKAPKDSAKRLPQR